MAQERHDKSYKAGETQLPEGLADLPLTGWLAGRGWRYHPHQLDVYARYREGRDVLLIAPTGGGKTLSGFIPVFEDLHRRGYKFKGLHTLYLSPLKALAVDIHRNLEKPINDLGLAISHETRTGDTPSHKRARQKTKPPNILLTTPESLALLLSYPDAPEMFANLQTVIVDEQHALMNNKRGDLLSLNLAVLERLAPQMRRIGLSATIAEPDIARAWLSKKAVLVAAPTKVKPRIDILLGKNRMPWSGHMATYAMPEVYAAIVEAKKSVVFVNTRAQAELIFQNLWKINDENLKIAVHHGSLDRPIRRKVEEKMAAGELDCVVATSSLDLGIDWADVSLVVQIGAPKGISRLMQRVGRSNHRMDEPSHAMLVPASRFEYLECVAAQEAVERSLLDGMELRKGRLDVLAQHVVGRACAGGFLPDQLYGEVLQAFPYRELDRREFDRVLQFTINGGYSLQNYDRFQRLVVKDDGQYEIANRKFTQLYRMNIGTIVESPTLKLKLRNKTLGTIEEAFIANLTQGDTFLFAGEVLRYEGMNETDVMVSRTKDDTAKIPSYAGGKFPLSSQLSLIVRNMLAGDRSDWQQYPQTVSEWLDHQKEQSFLPKPDHMLVETFPRQGKHYTVAYPFEGRNAHQTMGFLLMRRMHRQGARPLGFAATDYGIALWSLKPVPDIDALFQQDMLGDDLEEWLKETPLLKRLFRDVAVISGLVERSHPGQRKNGKQMTFSTDLIYDVLRKYEPDHILLQAAYQDAAGGLIDIGRLSALLERIQGKIDHHPLQKVSPLAIPLILEISRESMARKETAEYTLEDIEESLLEEVGLSS